MRKRDVFKNNIDVIVTLSAVASLFTYTAVVL